MMVYVCPKANKLLPMPMGVQDIFVKKVIRSKEKIARKSAKKRRGWYTVETMRTILQWSKSSGCRNSLRRKSS